MSNQYKGKSSFGGGAQRIAFNRAPINPIMGGVRPPGNKTWIAPQKADQPTNAVIGKVFSKSYTIAKFRSASGDATTPSYYQRILITNPSSFMRLRIVASFAPVPGLANPYTGVLDYGIGITPKWDLVACDINPSTGVETIMNYIYPKVDGSSPTFAAPQLPDAYELDTACNLIRADIYLTRADLPTSTNCDLVLSATWEADPTMKDEDRKYLFSQCNISGPNSPPEIRNA